jgi:hypothetical protein
MPSWFSGLGSESNFGSAKHDSASCDVQLEVFAVLQRFSVQLVKEARQQIVPVPFDAPKSLVEITAGFK